MGSLAYIFAFGGKVKRPHALPWWIILTVLVATMGCQALAGQTVTLAPEEDNFVGTSVAETVESGIIAPFTPTALPDVSPSPALTPQFEATDSPAGSTILVAYVDLNRNLWTWRAGSSPFQLTVSADVEDVRVSADGDWIAFTRTTNFLDYSLWAVRPDGGSETVLMDQLDFQSLPRPSGAISVIPYTFAWMPGTHMLAFNTRPAFEGLGLMLNDDLWLVNVDNGEPQQLLPPGEGGMFLFSPTGSQIAISTPDKISLIDADGSNRRDGVLSFSRISTYSEYLYYPQPFWAPDESYLRVVIPPAAAIENPAEPAQVWHIPADGASPSLVGSFNTPPLISPVLSPDLNKVAYLKQAGELAENRSELHIANADESSDELYLTETYLMFASWSPDSERFAFMVGDNVHPYLGQVGVGSRSLTDTDSAVDVRWLDAERFFFITRIGDSVELRLGAVDSPSELIASVTGDAAPFFNFDFTN